MKPSRTSFGIALGSNVGDGLANLQCGVRLLLDRIPKAELTGVGGVYQTAPVDCPPGTPMFLNSVCEIAADLTPQELHQHLMKIESALGRPRIREKNEPRTLDLDLLYAGDWVSDDPALTVPHPRLHLREFVLRPLADFRPNLVLPGQTQTIIELLAALPDDPDMRLLEGAALVEVG